MVLEAEQRLLEGAADKEAILVDEEDCLADEDDLWVDVMVLIVVNILSEEDDLLDELLVEPFVLTDDGVDDEMGNEFEVLLDLPELDIDLGDEIGDLEGGTELEENVEPEENVELEKIFEPDDAIEPEEPVELGDDVELEDTIVAACWELRTDTMEEATAEVLTGAVEESLLLADLSCGLAE
jgi:hypothetical protein